MQEQLKQLENKTRKCIEDLYNEHLSFYTPLDWNDDLYKDPAGQVVDEEQIKSDFIEFINEQINLYFNK